MKIWMFVYNNCRHDARVLKEAKTLAESGHNVQIAALSGEGLKQVEERDGFRIIRVSRSTISAISASDEHKPFPSQGIASSIRSRLAYHLFWRPLVHTRHWIKDKVSGPLRTFLLSIYRPLSFFQYSRRSWRLIKDEPADVYHCHDLNTLPLGYIAKRRHSSKLVYDAHELTTELAYISRFEKLIWKLLEKFLINRVNKVIVPGKHRGQYLSQKYKIAPPTVISNCPPALVPCHHNSSLIEKLGLKDNSVPIIIYQGGYSRGRGLHNLIIATSYLKNGVVVLTGWGALEQELRNMVSDRGLTNRVFFTEPVPPDELVSHAASASLGVVIYQFTSLNNYYACPNKLYEYINAGLPVVSSNFPSLKEIVEGYGFGKTFDPEKPRSIAAAIKWVVSDEERYRQMKRNAVEAAKIFNWENESAKLLELYSKLSRGS